MFCTIPLTGVQLPPVVAVTCLYTQMEQNILKGTVSSDYWPTFFIMGYISFVGCQRKFANRSETKKNRICFARVLHVYLAKQTSTLICYFCSVLLKSVLPFHLLKNRIFALFYLQLLPFCFIFFHIFYSLGLKEQSHKIFCIRFYSLISSSWSY